MILAENIFRNERFFMMMHMVFIMMSFMSSNYFRMSMHCCFVAHDNTFIVLIGSSGLVYLVHRYW